MVLTAKLLALRFWIVGWALGLTTLCAQTPSPFVSGVWSGNVTPTSATVCVRLNAAGQRVRLQLSQSESLAPAAFSAAVTTAAASGNTVKLTVQGLVPDTDYFYGIEVGGVLRREPVSRGRFTTLPLGKASFKVAFSSCGDFRAADQRAFPAIIAEKPLLFIHMGDLHYSDTNSTVAEDYRMNYDNVLGHAVQGPLFRSMPVVYTWDDHDFAGNDSDSTATSRTTARAAYRERVPHYPIGPTDGTIGQAFTIGRVRFIMTDLRSAAVASSLRESSTKTKLGAAQKAWFKQELINARDNGFPLIVWVCTHPWIAPAKLGDKLATLLFQLPPTMKCDAARLGGLRPDGEGAAVRGVPGEGAAGSGGPRLPGPAGGVLPDRPHRRAGLFHLPRQGRRRQGDPGRGPGAGPARRADGRRSAHPRFQEANFAANRALVAKIEALAALRELGRDGLAFVAFRNVL